jgi:predicted transglutaminase-like cysteine proteinase
VLPPCLRGQDARDTFLFVRATQFHINYGEILNEYYSIKMIAEIIKEFYDAEGRLTGSPSSRKRKKLFHATFPMGRYVSQPLSVNCRTIKELRKFLNGCKYVSDEEQFDRKDYWMPPEEFEKSKKGDCDDFALWTWRQLLETGC